MAENKFIQHLKGTETAGSVLEIKNQGTPATFDNMPAGTSNPNTAYADARGDATAVLKGTDVWKLDGSSLELASRVYGDGRDFTDTYTASGSSLWINATHTFDSAKIFGANTKWVLKLCGANLLSAVADTIDFSLIVKFGSTAVVTKKFTVAEQANNFCQQFVIDFNEWAQNVIKATNGDTMTIQLLCGDSTASATIYNGMTTLTALQRRVDGDVVASDTSTFDDLEQGLARKVDKVSVPNVVYGTDEYGAQTTYDVEDFGRVDDVQIDGVSIVQDKVANIPMATYLADYVLKTGDTMTGTLGIELPSGSTQAAITLKNGTAGTSADIKVSASGQIEFSRTVVFDGNIANGGQSISNIGSALQKWQRIYVRQINNGGNLDVPSVSGTIATKADVDLAANSGDQLTDKGVWYAKMYAATVAPSAEDGTNYADFSQTDGQGNPIIVLYERQNGAWVQTDTITPPAEYNGYVTVTSKIWDIVEQAGQQGGKILWSHNTKTFTPYPQIISFEDAHLTGNSTTQMPAQPTGDTIVNVDYLSNHAGSGKSVGDIFFTTRTDNGLAGAVECNGATYNTTDFVGSGSIGGLLADGKVPYVSLADYATALATNGVCGVYGWDGAGTTAFRVPSLTDIFVETGTAAQVGDYLPAGLPNITGTVKTGILWNVADAATGCFTQSGSGGNKAYENGSDKIRTADFDASRSSAIYGNSTTVQPNTVRYRAMVQLATGATDEALETCTNVLADVAGLKSHEVIAFQAPTAQNNYTWYRKYADGWVEQGGIINWAGATMGSGTTTSVATVSFPVEITKIVGLSFGDNVQFFNFHARNKSGTGMDVYASNQLPVSFTQAACEINWQVSGMAAS